MSNKCEVYFGLRGDEFDPAEVTKIIGLQPTSFGRKEVPRPAVSFWKYSLGWVEGEFIDIYKMSSDIVDLLCPNVGGIIKVKEMFNLEATLQIVLHISIDESISTPAIGFESKVIEFLYKTGGSIDIDTYRS